MMSFENLVALANHQERIKEARQMVWRVKGQPVVELDDVESCLKHAAVGGLREYCCSVSGKMNLVVVQQVPPPSRSISEPLSTLCSLVCAFDHFPGMRSGLLISVTNPFPERNGYLYLCTPYLGQIHGDSLLCSALSLQYTSSFSMPCQYFFPRRDYPQAAYYLIRSATKRWSASRKNPSNSLLLPIHAAAIPPGCR